MFKVDEDCQSQEDVGSSLSKDGTPNSSINKIHFLKTNTLPRTCPRALEVICSELHSQDPLLTVMRNLQRDEFDMEQLDQLRLVGEW